jgi:hypothetical protein
LKIKLKLLELRPLENVRFIIGSLRVCYAGYSLNSSFMVCVVLHYYIIIVYMIVYVKRMVHADLYMFRLDVVPEVFCKEPTTQKIAMLIT